MKFSPQGDFIISGKIDKNHAISGKFRLIFLKFSASDGLDGGGDRKSVV